MFAVSIINRWTRETIEWIYPFDTRDDAREYGINLCNTVYAGQFSVIYRVEEVHAKE